MSILKYQNFIKESLEDKDINIDVIDEKELNRILICSNDGQGDTNCYTFEDIYEIVSDSDIKYQNSWVKGSDVIEKMKRSEILDEFCRDMSYNMTEYIYFNVSINKYQRIKWINS